MLQQQETLYVGSHVQFQISKSNRSCRQGRMCESTPRIFFSYTIASIPVHRKHPKFTRDPDFQVAVAVSILRVLNVWQELKLMNIPLDSDSELDLNSEK